MTTETSTPRAGYWQRWATVPREITYLFIAFPIAIVGFGLTVGLFSAGFGTIFTFFIGLILLILCLYIARGFGTLDLSLLKFSGRPEIARPEWQDARARTGFLGWVRAVLGNGHYWLYLLHVMLVDFIVKTITWSLMITAVASSLGGVTFWFWDRFVPHPNHDFFPTIWFFDHLGIPVNSLDGPTTEAVVYFVLGLIFLALLPYITRGLVTVHWLIARGVLGAWKSDALQREVIQLSESRGAAHAAEGTALRRLERDIHDGPQQRLVRMQMDLAAADRKLDSDPKAARALIEEAMQQSKDALDELRALSRGFAPPILLDRGLVAALESLAVRSAVPATVTSELPEGTELPAELERNAYFIAAEALTNVAKHADANAATVTVALRDGLEIVVHDDGHGGATSVDGHGIAGLAERVHGLGGTLDVVSPDGGPTTVTAHLPIDPSASAG
jgi:signal transduction histidine kinase